MASAPGDTVYVYGRYSLSNGLLTLQGYGSSSQNPNEQSPSEVSDNEPGAPNIVDVVVTARCQSANQVKCVQAGQILVNTLANIENQINSTDPNKEIVVFGRRMTVQQFQFTYDNTAWIISDIKDYKNNGRGSSNYGKGGQNVDTVYYGILVDDGTGSGTYSGSQVTAIVMHELAHLTDIGNSFFEDSYTLYNNEPVRCRADQYYNSAFATNVESFANDLAAGIGNAIGLGDFDNFRPGNFIGTEEPQAIYNREMAKC